MQNMDELDPNMICEVPDSPSRLRINCPVDQSSEPSWEVVDAGQGTNWSLSRRDLRHPNKIYFRRLRDSSHHDGRNVAPSRSVDLFRREDSARSSVQPIDANSDLGPTVISNQSGESMEMTELLEKSLYPLSYPKRHRGLRRKVANLEHKENGAGSSRTNRLLRIPCSASEITSTLKHDVVEEKTSKLDEGNLELKPRDKGKRVDVCSNPQPGNGSTSSRRVLENNNSVDQTTRILSDRSSDQDNGNGIDLCRNTDSDRIWTRGLRSTRRRRLVHNGWIPPLSIEQERTTLNTTRDKAENNGISSHEIHIISPDSDDRCAEKLKGKMAVDSFEVSDEGHFRHFRDNSPLRSAGSLFGKEVSATADEEDSSDSFEGTECRTIRPHTRKPSTFPSLDGTGSVPENEDAMRNRSSSTAFHADHDATSLPHCSHIISASNLQTRNLRGKRKFSCTRSRAAACSSLTSGDPEMPNLQSGQALNSESVTGLIPQQNGIRLGQIIEVDDLPSPEVAYSGPSQHNARVSDRLVNRARQIGFRTGECSSSTSSDPEMSNLQSGQASQLRSVRGHILQRSSNRLGPIIEVDDLQSPEVVSSSPSHHNARASDQSVDRTRQVESDEILARQLQEELYNNTPITVGAEEIDATVGWSLLQEDDSQHDFGRRRDQFHSGDASSSSALAGFHQSFTRATNHARRSMSNRLARLRRELNRPVTGGMASEMSIEVLEALELALDDGIDAPRHNLIHQIQRDFNENDYEMLLALDENNDHAGASESQINNLPLSVIQNDKPEETCAVCLEAPSVGDTVRHLPCLHKFHKECIDTWLRRRTSCPICKSGIT